MRTFLSIFCSLLLVEAVSAGQWLDCKIAQTKHPEKQIDCSKFESEKNDRVNNLSDQGKNNLIDKNLKTKQQPSK